MKTSFTFRALLAISTHCFLAPACCLAQAHTPTATKTTGPLRSEIGQPTTLHVARGILVTNGISSSSRLARATYHIVEVARGRFTTNEIVVFFYADSLRGPSLPRNAILLLEQDAPPDPASVHPSWWTVYRALGREAWRGILPDTPEAWSRIAASSDEALASTPHDLQLPAGVALELAEEAVIDHGEYSEHVRYSQPKRTPFGWLIVAHVLTLATNGNAFVLQRFVRVNDEGEIIKYSPGREVEASVPGGQSMGEALDDLYKSRADIVDITNRPTFKKSRANTLGE